MFNRIDRYISGMFWLYFVGALVIFITLFTAIDALSTLVAYKEADSSAIIPYYLYGLPEIVYRMAPVACLMSTIFTLSTLNKNNELVALYASGMSLFRINRAIILGVVLISYGIFYISDRVLPNFTKQKNFIFFHQIKKSPGLYSLVRNSKIWYRSKEAIYYFKTLNSENQTASGLTLYFINDKWDLIQMISAQKVQIENNKWHLKDGSVTLFTEDSSFPLTQSFKEKTILMAEEAKDIAASANTSEVLSVQELQSFIKRNKEAGLDTIGYEVDYHSKFSFSLAALVMTIVGIPFSVTRTRSGGAMVNVGICLGVVFLYWTFLSSALTLGKHGAISPIVAAWVPNLLMALMGLLVIRRK